MIPWLINKGYLKAVKEYTYIRIDEDSISEFNEEYVACSWIAKKLNSSSVRIRDCCTKNDVKLLEAKRKSNNSIQSFMRRESMEKIYRSIKSS